MDQSTGSVRALIDTNLLISALISTHPERSAAAAVLFGALSGAFIPVVPPEALEKFTRIVAEKCWLASRVTPDRAEEFLRDVTTPVEIPQWLEKPLPQICRDSGTG